MLDKVINVFFVKTKLNKKTVDFKEIIIINNKNNNKKIAYENCSYAIIKNVKSLYDIINEKQEKFTSLSHRQ